jgi:Ca2+-binding RTX toxin-like protein
MGGSGNDGITITSTGTDNISGGAGNDTVVYSTAGGLALTDTIDGGAGTDTLRATSADFVGISGSTPSVYNITNVETLQVLGAHTGVLRAPNIGTTVNRVNLAPIVDGTVGSGTVVGPAGVFTVNLGGSTTGQTYTAANALNGGLTVTAAGTANTDSLTIANTAVISSAGGAALNVYAGQAIAINGYETVTLTTGTVGGTANTINTLTVTPDLGGKANVTLSGANGLTFAGVVTADSLDASAVSGAISMAAGANTATTIAGGIGGDTLRGTAALANNISGNAGDDSIFGGAGNDTLAGGDGADTIEAGSGNDNISGGSGNDVIVMAGNLTSADVIDGGDGVDTLTISVALGTTGTPNFTSIELLGLSASGVTQDMNAFTGTGLTQVLIDGTGNSITNAASVLTTLNVAVSAHNGALTFGRLINTTNDSVTVNFAGGGATTLANTTSFAGEESITIGRFGTTSGSGNLVTFTTPTLTAMKTLTLNGEHNYAIGSNGATAFATLNAANATGTVSVDASASTVAFTATVSGAAAVTLTGGSGSDVLPGTAFADSLTGGDGADSITAGAGDDFVSGGRGADTLAGGDGTDTLSYTGQGAVFDLGGSVAAAGMAINLGSTSITGATITTNSAPTGSGGTASALSAGLAVLPAGQAAYLGAETAGGSTISIVSAVVDTVSGFENVEGSTLADIIVGSSAANILLGLAGADFISGGSGNDTIDGGASATTGDHLTGGAGRDTFVFATRTEAKGVDAGVQTTTRLMDHITDFTVADDFIQFGLGAAVFGTGITFTAATTATITAIAVPAATRTDFAAVAAAAQAVTNGAQSTSGAAQFYLVTVGATTTATAYSGRTFLVLNDNTDTIALATETWIDVTGISGTLTAANIFFG